MADSRVFSLNGNRIEAVCEQLEGFLRTEKKMEVQSAPVDGGFLLQAGQPKDVLRSLSGMRIATNVQLSASGDELTVTIGEGQWMDKLGAGAVGVFFLWPLAITAGIGAYKQKMLPSEIFDFISRTLGSQGTPAAFTAAPSPAGAPAQSSAPFTSISCPQCGAKLSADSKFCNKCGAKIKSTCPGCGAAVTPGSKFCSQCGQPL